MTIGRMIPINSVLRLLVLGAPQAANIPLWPAPQTFPCRVKGLQRCLAHNLLYAAPKPKPRPIAFDEVVELLGIAPLLDRAGARSCHVLSV